MNQDQDPFKGQRIIIREGWVKKNINPPPTHSTSTSPKGSSGIAKVNGNCAGCATTNKIGVQPKFPPTL